MKALVIGGTGFIGCHIVNSLLTKGIEVKVLIRRKSEASHLTAKGVLLQYGDVLDIGSLRQNMKEVDLVFSAFGLLGEWGIPEQLYWDINTNGVKNLLASFLDSNIEQFIHISSAGVLGPLPYGVVADESFPYNPSNVYEKTKCEAEKAILDSGKRRGVPFTIIRPEFVYGPGDTHVLGLFKAIHARRFVLLGDGRSFLHPTYIDDLIQGISRCLYRRNAVGKIYLITGHRPYTVRELAKIIAEELGVRLSKLKIPLPLAKTAATVFEYVARFTMFQPPLTTSRVKFFTENRAFSCAKARRELGYTPKVDLREGVSRTITWYRENRYL